MNWEAIGAVAEIVGAIAVVVSILYLAFQVNSNTRAMKATASYDAAHSWATTNENAVSWEPRMKELVMKAMDGVSSWEDFSAAERFDVALIHRSLFQKLEGQYFLYKYDYLDAGIWEKRKTWARSLIELPFFRTWWEEEHKQLIYSDEFVESIAGASAVPIRMGGADRSDA